MLYYERMSFPSTTKKSYVVTYRTRKQLTSTMQNLRLYDLSIDRHQRNNPAHVLFLTRAWICVNNIEITITCQLEFFFSVIASNQFFSVEKILTNLLIISLSEIGRKHHWQLANRKKSDEQVFFSSASSSSHARRERDDTSCRVQRR